MNLNQEAKKWLDKYACQLESEDILGEEEKIQYSFSNEEWPIPIKHKGMGIFLVITDETNFNKIISNPHYKEEILNNRDLYENWILPHAVLLFGKTWFDSVKWRKQIKSGVPFSLFNKEDMKELKKLDCNLENTTAGKAIISTIINKTSFALRMFLSRDRQNSNPGAYIIESIKNEIINQRGAEEGYKLQSVIVCPYCLSQKGKTNYKVPLTSCGHNEFSCSKCEERSLNYKIQMNEGYNKGIEENYNKFSLFKNFFGMTVVCPSDICTGKFIPVEFIDGVRTKELNKLYVKGTKAFRKPPINLLEKNVKCPYCRIRFNIGSALNKKTGWKGMSGYLTGLPQAIIWKKRIGHEFSTNKELSIINEVAGINKRPEDNIFIKQNLKVLREDIMIKMAEVNKDSYSGLVSWYFYIAAIKWTCAFPEDAFRYFFSNFTQNVRGHEKSIHQSFFHIWLDLLSENIKDFNQFEIFKLEDFKWFCHRPKFSHGPQITFDSKVNLRKRVDNINNDIRLVTILSVKKDGVEYVDDISLCEWQAIQLKSCSNLQIGDVVQIKALVMPGHHSHAPIKRIGRLKNSLFNSIVQTMLEEERTGARNKEFWNKWNKKLEFAKSKIKLSLGGKTHE